MAHPRRILIVRLSAIGDCLHCTPAAQALRQTFPDAEIGWVVHTHCAAVVRGNPFVDRIHEWPRQDRWRALIALRKELRRHRYEVSIDLQGLLKSALVGWVSGARERWGPADARERAPFLYNRWMPAQDGVPVLEANLNRVAAAGARWTEQPPMFAPFDEADAASVRIQLEAAGCDLARSLVAVNPATSRPIKDWKAERFGELARRLAEHGHTVVLTGGPADAGVADEVLAASWGSPVASLVGQTSLRELAALLHMARLFVGGDTGPMHIARAVGTPVLALFGPSDADVLGPTPDEGLALTKRWHCSPCRHKVCPIQDACLNAITVDEVFASAMRLLGVSTEPKEPPSG